MVKDYLVSIRLFAKLALVVINVSLLGTTQVLAGKPEHIKPFSLGLSYIQAGESQVSDTNNLSRQGWELDTSLQFPLGKKGGMGLSFSADRLDFQLTNSFAFGGGWDDIQRYRAGVSFMYRPDNHWLLLFAPKLQYAWADGAHSSDANSYGAVASAMYRFDADHTLGIGVAYLNDIGRVRTIPYIAVKWQLAEKWQLANPFEAGFSGPAGLELRYQYSANWQFGIGSSRRTQRFLTALGKDKVAEIEEWVGFARASWQMTRELQISAYGGWYFDSLLEISKVEYPIDSQVAAALAIRMRF